MDLEELLDEHELLVLQARGGGVLGVAGEGYLDEDVLRQVDQVEGDLGVQIQQVLGHVVEEQDLVLKEVESVLEEDVDVQFGVPLLAETLVQ